MFFLKAWKRNHKQLDGVVGSKGKDASPDFDIEKRYYRKAEQNDMTGKGYKIQPPTTITYSEKPIENAMSNKEGLDGGDISTSSRSSFSSIASVKRNPVTINQTDRTKPASSLIIPPRAPVLETLKRTKRELGKKQDNKNLEGGASKVYKYPSKPRII